VSLSALPAICLCLFFMCDVFFFGTARSIDSHMSARMEGIEAMLPGKEIGRARAIGGAAAAREKGLEATGLS
jgi:hypothetical protein